MNENLEAIIILLAAIGGVSILGFFTTNYLGTIPGIILIFWTGYKIRESKECIEKEEKKKISKESEEDLKWKEVLKNKKQ